MPSYLVCNQNFTENEQHCSMCCRAHNTVIERTPFLCCKTVAFFTTFTDSAKIRYLLKLAKYNPCKSTDRSINAIVVNCSVI